MGPASMGMMTKGVCRAMLKFGNAKLKGKNAIRHSFGGSGSGTVRRESQWGRSSLTTSTTNNTTTAGAGAGASAGGDRQYSEDSTLSAASLLLDHSDIAYASVPLLSAADRFVVTPAGSTPPDIHQEFQESVGSRSRRQNHPDTVKFDNNSTYSITFKGRNIDFCEWSTCGFYMIKSASLNSFLGASSGLRLVAYCFEQPSPSPSGRSSTPISGKPSSDFAPVPSQVPPTSYSLEMLATQSISKMVYLMEINVTASTSQIMVSNDDDDDDESDTNSETNSDTDEIPELDTGKNTHLL